MHKTDDIAICTEDPFPSGDSSHSAIRVETHLFYPAAVSVLTVAHECKIFNGAEFSQLRDDIPSRQSVTPA